MGNESERLMAVAEAVKLAFESVAFPGNRFLSDAVLDLDEKNRVKEWVDQFSRTSIDKFFFDGSNISTIAMIYASPEGVRWILPRYIYDYTFRYEEDKYSLYPIMGQIEHSEFFPGKVEKVISLMSDKEISTVHEFIRLMKDMHEGDFEFDRISKTWKVV